MNTFGRHVDERNTEGPEFDGDVADLTSRRKSGDSGPYHHTGNQQAQYSSGVEANVFQEVERKTAQTESSRSHLNLMDDYAQNFADLNSHENEYN